MRCTSYCTAQSYKLKDLAQSLGTAELTQIFPDAYHMPYKGGDAFCFSYGCVVFWGLKGDQEREFLNQLNPFEEKPHLLNTDEFAYDFEENYWVKNDTIMLDKKKS